MSVHAITSKSLVERSQMQIRLWSRILGDCVELLPKNQSGTGNQKAQQRKEFYSHRVASGLVSETWGWVPMSSKNARQIIRCFRLYKIGARKFQKKELARALVL